MFLQLLERHGARGTFFMLGQNAANHPDVVRRVASGGHGIGNHGWDHPEFPAISVAERRRQVLRCAEATAPFGSRLFRPPKSLQSVGSYLTIRALGFEPVLWSAEVEDWRIQETDRMASLLVERIKPGRIVVLHDTLWHPMHPEAADRTGLLQALDKALQALAGAYRFVTVRELMRRGRPVRRRWFVHSDDEWD